MIKQITCPRCGGSGKVDDSMSVGSYMRGRRKASGKSLRKVAALMGFCPSYLSDLELGRRVWTIVIKEKFIAAISKVNQK